MTNKRFKPKNYSGKFNKLSNQTKQVNKITHTKRGGFKI